MSAISGASTASSLINAGRLSVTGLASGLDVDKILEGLLSIGQKRVDALQTRGAVIQQQQAAFKGIEARLLTFQSNLFQLARSQNGAFDVRTVASSDDKILTAAAGPSARPGTYQVRVNALAQAHQVAAQGYESATAAITQGTLQISSGTGAVSAITIDASNNTLQGLANAINSSASGVSATIVNDGSAASPYRLLLTASKSGAANAITVTNNLAADAGGAVRPVFDQASIGPAGLDPTYTGTSIPTANSGPGAYTGTANNTYTFTVVSGGTVGTDNNLQVAFTDATGGNTGTLTLNAGDADLLKSVAQGIEVKFAAGTLVAGQKFTVKATVPTVQAAQDASVTLGSGPGALTVTNAANQIDNLFPGVSLNLKGADPARTVTLTVASDTQQARKGIGDFVAAFNDLMAFIDEQVDFNAEANVAGTLLGNRQATAIQDQVRDLVLKVVPGLKAQMNRLSAIGIATTDEGRLSLNQAKLDDVLAGKVAGVTLEDVRKLFAFSGSSPVPGIEFVTGSAKTKASSAPYQVVVSQAARQARIQAANPLAASTVIDGTNNTLTVQVDGTTSAAITLRAGTYSRAGLAQELQARINAEPTLIGRSVAVSVESDRLVLTSASYGSTSKVAMAGGTALVPLGFAGTESDVGQDVVGHFVVNGQVEAASGQGQILLGNVDNANTSALQVRVNLSAAQVGAGLTADFTVTRGLASATDVALASLLDPVTGRLKTVKDGFQERIDDINGTITRTSRITEQRREALLRQFVALERTVSQLQSLGSFLTTQFAQINGQRR